MAQHTKTSELSHRHPLASSGKGPGPGASAAAEPAAPRTTAAPADGDDTEAGRGGRLDSTLLLGLGLLVFVTGVAVAAGPLYSWRVVKLGQTLTDFGIHSGLLVFGGFVLFGLGMMGRVVAHASVVHVPRREDEADFALVAEQLANDLAQVRSSLLQISEELGAISSSQEVVIQQQRAALGDDSSADQQDALFRLAASLDQLNGRIEDRVTALNADVREQLHQLVQRVESAHEGLHDELAETRRGFEQVRDGYVADLEEIRQAIPSAAAPARTAAPRPVAVGEPSPDGEPRVQLDRPPARAAREDRYEELEVLVDLDLDDADVDGDEDPNHEFFETIEELDAMVSDPGRPGKRATARERAPQPPLPRPRTPAKDSFDSLLPDDEGEPLF